MIENVALSDGATLKATELAERFNVTRQTIYIWMNERGFPKPVRKNPRVVRWVPSQVDAWAVAQTDYLAAVRQ